MRWECTRGDDQLKLQHLNAIEVPNWCYSTYLKWDQSMHSRNAGPLQHCLEE